MFPEPEQLSSYAHQELLSAFIHLSQPDNEGPFYTTTTGVGIVQQHLLT